MKKFLFFLGLATLSSCSYNLYSDGSDNKSNLSYSVAQTANSPKGKNQVTTIDVSLYNSKNESYDFLSKTYLTSIQEPDSIVGNGFYYNQYIHPYSTQMILEERPNCWIYQNRSGDVYTRLFYKKGLRFKTYQIEFDHSNQVRNVTITRDNDLEDRIIYTYDDRGLTKRELFLSNGNHLIEHYEYLANGEVQQITINTKDGGVEKPFLLAGFEYPTLNISTSK